MHTTSPSLLMRLREPGQSAAWSRFVRLYSPMLYTWAKKLGLQHADIADLMQEVFAVLVRKLPEFRYQDHRSFRNWLWVMTRNKWRDRCRRQETANDAAASNPKAAFALDPNSLEDAEERAKQLEQIRAVLEQHFQPSTRKAFWAHVAEGKTAAQVAEELGISVGAVHQAKFRVLSKLYQEFADLSET